MPRHAADDSSVLTDTRRTADVVNEGFGRIAIVIPVLNEEKSLSELLPEIFQVTEALPHDFEVLVVDDGSTDQSSLVAEHHGAIVLRSTRNLGKSAALQAGFDATQEFDVVITMDGDLQDNPIEIPRMLDALKTADVVSGWKAQRKDPWRRRIQSRVFTSAVRRMTGIDLHDFNCGFKAYRRTVLDGIRLNGDQHRLIPVLAVEAGFTVIEIAVNHRPRVHGRSRFGLNRLLRGPLDLVTVMFLNRFGRRPLHVFGTAGLLVGGIGFIIGAYLTWLRFQGEAIGDRPLLMLAVLMMLGGLQLFAVGLLGEMLLVSERTRSMSPFQETARTHLKGASTNESAVTVDTTVAEEARTQL